MTNASTRTGRRVAFSSLAVALGIAMSVAGAGQANAAGPTTVDLGLAESFAVLGSTTVTNTGPSVISGDLGLYPGSDVPGFPPGLMTPTKGNIHINDGPAGAARAALNTAYLQAKNTTLPAPVSVGDLGGSTLTAGLYNGGAITNTGTLTLDGNQDPSSVWIFQASSTLITSDSSKVALINGADPCNVFWQVTTSATLAKNSLMVGTVMAHESITAVTGASVEGRLLAYTGAVTLDSNNIAVPAACAGTIAAGGTTTSPVATPPAGPIAPEGPKLADTGADVGPYIIGILTLAGGGVALLYISGSASRRRRSARHSQ